MTAKLIIEEGDSNEWNLSSDEDIWVIGTNESTNQVVISDPLVADQHLLIQKNDQNFTIENLSGQENTAFLNGESINENQRPLNDNDLIKVGNTSLRFHYSEELQADSETETDEIIPYKDDELTDYLDDLTSPENTSNSDYEGREDTIFEEADETVGALAEINFGLIEEGRWLLKVVGGPNNGAEFYMQTGQSYLIGTDPHSCDIVFHDTSVSRQHAKISVSEEDVLTLEDMKSRNGVFIDGSAIEQNVTLNPNTLVTLGTTSFIVYDREGEMQTIISPLLPSIVKALQQETAKEDAEAKQILEKTANTEQPESSTPFVDAQQESVKHSPRSIAPILLLAGILGLFALVAIGTMALFKAEPVVMEQQENADELIQQVLKSYPAIRYSYNKSTGSLLLIGHVASANDKTQLLYHLQGLKFIKSIDDSGIVIDEYVWRELNSVLARNPAWKGVSLRSAKAGEFTLTGYLQTRKQAEELSAYISLNFPYLDLLKKQIVVEEDVLSQINGWLQKATLTNVSAKIANGDITLSGNAPPEKMTELDEIVQKIKQIPGLRNVNNGVKPLAPDLGMVNLSDQYEVTGKSRIGSKWTVVVGGRILTEGDNLDGMDIKKITANTIFLEKGETKYRIDY